VQFLNRHLSSKLFHDKESMYPLLNFLRAHNYKGMVSQYFISFFILMLQIVSQIEFVNKVIKLKLWIIKADVWCKHCKTVVVLCFTVFLTMGRHHSSGAFAVAGV
jgi:hypothetical protein